MVALADIIGYGLAASRPAAGTEGRIYYSTDTGVLERDNGSSWDNIGSKLTVQEEDGTPLDAAVTIIRVTNGKLTDNGAGDVSLDLSGGGGGGGATIGRGAYSSRPAAGTSGDLYFTTDGRAVYRDNGSSWDAYGPIYPLVEPPIVSNWTWLNQGSATATDDNGAIVLQIPVGSGNNVRGLYRTAPSPPYTVTALLQPTATGTGGNSTGIFFRQSSDGKLHLWQLVTQTTLNSTKYSSATALSALYATQTLGAAPNPIWLRIADDNTNRVCSFSADGRNWMVLHSVGRTDYLTADQIGFYCEASNGNRAPYVTLSSWDVA